MVPGISSIKKCNVRNVSASLFINVYVYISKTSFQVTKMHAKACEVKIYKKNYSWQKITIQDWQGFLNCPRDKN